MTLLTLVMVALVSALLVLLVDGGSCIKAATQADTYAAEAARASVAEIGPVSGGSQADAQAAAAAARQYLTATRASGSARITGPGRVEVTVTVTVRRPLSRAVYRATRSQTAQLQVGVESGGAPQ